MELQSFYTALIGILHPYPLNMLQTGGIVFLLGSYTVASLSDLKRMAAQKEFTEVWLLFTGTAFAYDFYRLSGDIQVGVFAAKWTLMFLFALLSWRYFGVVLSLSGMDITAACAAMSLLSPLYIMAYYLLLVLTNALFRPVLGRFGDGISTPFLPVVLAATVVTLALTWVLSHTTLTGFFS